MRSALNECVDHPPLSGKGRAQRLPKPKMHSLHVTRRGASAGGPRARTRGRCCALGAAPPGVVARGGASHHGRTSATVLRMHQRPCNGRPTAGNHYQTLGVEVNAGEEQIKAAFRRRAKELHPDVCTAGVGPPVADAAGLPGCGIPPASPPASPPTDDAEAQFMAAKEAYETLSDPGRRSEYDAAHSIRRLGASPGAGGRVLGVLPAQQLAQLPRRLPPALPQQHCLQPSPGGAPLAVAGFFRDMEEPRSAGSAFGWEANPADPFERHRCVRTGGGKARLLLAGACGAQHSTLCAGHRQLQALCRPLSLVPTFSLCLAPLCPGASGRKRPTPSAPTMTPALGPAHPPA